MASNKEIFLQAAEGVVDDLAYYNWKNNDDMTPDDAVELLHSGEITMQEILDAIEKGFRLHFKDLS